MELTKEEYRFEVLNGRLREISEENKEMIEQNKLILKNQKQIMLDLTKLQAAVDGNSKAIAALQAQINGSTDQAAVDTLTQTITDNNANLNNLITPPPTA